MRIWVVITRHDNEVVCVFEDPFENFDEQDIQRMMACAETEKFKGLDDEEYKDNLVRTGDELKISSHNTCEIIKEVDMK